MAEVEIPNLEELEEAKGKAFTRRVALTTAVFAVILAITSMGGNNSMKGMLLAQQQASDQWAYYQAKSIREHLYDTQKTILVALLEDRAGSSDARKKRDELLRKMEAESARYGLEKQEIERKAKELEQERDRNENKDPYFDYGEVLLQIAIVMSSIAILASSRQMYRFSLVAATLGTLMSLNGFFQFFRIPFFH